MDWKHSQNETNMLKTEVQKNQFHFLQFMHRGNAKPGMTRWGWDVWSFDSIWFLRFDRYKQLKNAGGMRLVLIDWLTWLYPAIFQLDQHFSVIYKRRLIFSMYLQILSYIYLRIDCSADFSSVSWSVSLRFMQPTLMPVSQRLVRLVCSVGPLLILLLAESNTSSIDLFWKGCRPTTRLN